MMLHSSSNTDSCPLLRASPPPPLPCFPLQASTGSTPQFHNVHFVCGMIGWTTRQTPLPCHPSLRVCKDCLGNSCYAETMCSGSIHPYDHCKSISNPDTCDISVAW